MIFTPIHRQGESLGAWGERVAARYLFWRGWHLLERNWRDGHCEIDIICSRGKTLAIVEVKTRTQDPSAPARFLPRDAVDAEKRRHLRDAARVYAKARRTGKAVRFDVIEVYASPEGKLLRLHHIPGAFPA